MKLNSEVVAALETLIQAAESPADLKKVSKLVNLFTGERGMRIPRRPYHRSPEKRIEIVCEYCGKKALVNKNGRNKYCSHVCKVRAAAMRKKIL